MKLKKLPIFHMLLVFLSSTLPGAPSIQNHLRSVRGVEFSLLREVSDWNDNSNLGPFPASLLEESILESYSLWRLDGGPLNGLQMEVFELLDPPGAYALFSLWPQVAGSARGDALKLPMKNDFSPQEAVLWAGNYLIRFHSPSSAEIPKKQFERFASAFLDTEELESILPLAVRLLPSAGLVQNSIHFYLGRKSLSLNPKFPLPLLDVIGFQDRVQVAFGRYQPSDSSLFVLVYPTPALAQNYFPRIQSSLSRYFSEQGAFLKRSGIIVSLFSGPEADARTVLEGIEYKPTVRWIQHKGALDREGRTPAQYRSFFAFLTSTFLGIGFSLILVCLAGVLAGLIRYQTLVRFPLLFRRNEMIRLRLME